MCNESINLVKDELAMLKLTKKYLIDNEDILITHSINRISKSHLKYKYDLLDKEDVFKDSINIDFKLAIEYCDTLDDKAYEDNRYIVENLDNRIYCDFYNYLSNYIEIETIEEDWVKSNLLDIFGFFASLHCKKN